MRPSLWGHKTPGSLSQGSNRPGFLPPGSVYRGVVPWGDVSSSFKELHEPTYCQTRHPSYKSQSPRGNRARFSCSFFEHEPRTRITKIARLASEIFLSSLHTYSQPYRNRLIGVCRP